MMLSELVTIALLATAPTVAAVSQNAGQNTQQSYVQSVYTEGTLNGRAWAVWSVTEKLVFLDGISAGEWYALIAAPEGMSRITWCRNCVYADVIKGIDQFYRSNTAYLPIPVVVAFHYYAGRASGANSAEDIETLARNYLAGIQQRSGTNPQLPSPSAPPLQSNSPAREKPLHLNQVNLLPAKPNPLGRGCSGALEISESDLEWIDNGECQEALEFSSSINSVREVVYEDWSLGKFSAAVWLTRSNANAPTHFSMAKGNAQRLLRNLKKRRPELPQRCFLASSTNKYEIACDAW